jgi:hypothetical protein
MGAVKKNGDNEYLFVTGYHKDSCTTMGGVTVKYTYPAIGRMDSLGTILEFRRYSLNAECTNIPGDLEFMNDGSMVVWGRHDRFFMFKVDSLAIPLWGRRFTGQGSIRYVKELPNGDLFVGFDMAGAGASLARMDADGNFLWAKSFMRPTGKMHDAVLEADGSIVVTGYTGTGSAIKLFMMKIDPNGVVLWCRGYDRGPNGWYIPTPSRIRSTLDGKYVVLATLGYPTDGFFDRPFLMKSDLNGDTLWTSSMGATGYQYYTRDLLASSDGGFLFSGIVWGDLPDGNSGLPYIAKADSLGNFPCHQRHHPVQVVDLFPTDSTFTLTYVDGITAYPALVNDTVFDPLTIYSGCTFTTGMPQAVRRSREVKVYPNPTPGRFTMEFSDPLLRESYYSVYDATGRLLLQRPLPSGATLEEVDLSRFGSGAYVLRVTDPAGVRHEQVVVE